MAAVPGGLVDPTDAASLWAAMALPRRACMGPTAPTAIIHTPTPTRVPTAITHTPVATAIIPTIAAISGAPHSHPNHRLVAPSSLRRLRTAEIRTPEREGK